MLKLLQFFFKTLAYALSKIAAKNTYYKLYKYFMKYKIISILYNPFKIIFNNLIFTLKIIGTILSIFSLFNLSLLHFNYDLIDEIKNYINEIIKWIRNLYSQWFEREEEEIYEPKEFLNFKSRKEIKAIEKTIANSNQYWVIPFIIIGGVALFCFNPDINGILNPIITKIEDKMPVNYGAVISGIFTYKFITFTFSKITGFKLGNDNPDDNPDNISVGESNSNPASHASGENSPINNRSNADYVRDTFREIREREEAWTNLPRLVDDSVVDFIRESTIDTGSTSSVESIPKASTSNLPPETNKKIVYLEQVECLDQ